MSQLARVRELVENKWCSLLAGLCMMAAAGTQYMFSTYSPQVKDLLLYDQSEINFIGSMANVGVYIGFWTGFCHDHLGARITAASSGVLFFIGWFCFYLGLVGVLPSNYILMGFFMFVAGNGSAAAYTSALANNVNKFPIRHRGAIVGLLVSLFGLSAAIFTEVYTWIFQESVEPFILFFAICLPLLGFLGVIFLYPPPATPVAVIDYDEVEEGSGANFAINETTALEETAKKFKCPLTATGAVQEMNVLQSFLTWDFWILVSLFFLLTGVGLMMFNNLGNMVLSAGGEDGQQAPMVTLLSITNSLARLVVGWLSDVFLTRDVMSRPTLLFLTQIFMVVTQVYFALITVDAIGNAVPLFYPGVILLGIAYGSLFSVTPTLIGELLGHKHFASHWSVQGFAPAISSVLVSTVLAGHLYDNAADGASDCYGWDCYGWTLIISSVLAAVGVLLCAVQAVRWRFYMTGRVTPKYGVENSLL